MRFKSSVLKTIKVCQNSHIRNPKHLPPFRTNHAPHVKHQAPSKAAQRPNQ